MSPPLPSFLRRHLLLHEARRALLGGEPELALERLGDPCLALSDEAARLRERVVDVICREAGRATAEGAHEEAERLLSRAEVEDPERARQWRRRLDGESGPASQVDVSSRAMRQSSRLAMGELLAQMRQESGDSGGVSPASTATPLVAPPSTLIPGPSSGRRPLRFHLAVDDAGEYFAIGGDEVVIGHRSAERADLPILGDLDSVHARILRSESFHGGPAWMIQPAQGCEVRVGGAVVPEGGAALHDGVEVQLSRQVSFRFRLPDPSSCSALIEFLRGIECEGANRVLLFAQGPAGRVCTGRRLDRLLVVRGEASELCLELNGDELFCSSPAGLRQSGAAEATDLIRVSVPPASPLSLTVGPRTTGRPPFGITLRATLVRGSGEWR
jgi:hypothetical protein